MNKVMLVGRLVADPTHRQTQSGVSVCEIRLAVPNRMDKDKSYYFNVTAWKGTADLCAKYLVKGQRVAVVGELQSRTYEAKDGSKRYTVDIRAEEIDFLDKPARTDQAAGAMQTPEELQGFSDISDEEMPF